MAGGLVVAIAIAGILSSFASGEPDGLERVAIDQGFEDTAEDPKLDSPLADYSVKGIENDGLATGLAGVIGVIVTLGLMIGILKIVQWHCRPDPGSST